MTALLVALGAAIGAPVRFALARLLDDEWPVGTLLVNVAGAGLVGCFAALSLTEEAWALLGVGFCGGFTTWSALADQTVALGARRGSAYLLLTVCLGVGACALGFALAA